MFTNIGAAMQLTRTQILANDTRYVPRTRCYDIYSHLYV